VLVKIGLAQAEGDDRVFMIYSAGIVDYARHYELAGTCYQTYDALTDEARALCQMLVDLYQD